MIHDLDCVRGYVTILAEAGFVERERHGRRNRYVINRDEPMLRHAAQEGQEIGALLSLLRLADLPE